MRFPGSSPRVSPQGSRTQERVENGKGMSTGTGTGTEPWGARAPLRAPPGLPACRGSLGIAQEGHGGLSCCHVASIKPPRGAGWRPRGPQDGSRWRKKLNTAPRRPPRRPHTSPDKQKSLTGSGFSMSFKLRRYNATDASEGQRWL